MRQALACAVKISRRPAGNADSPSLISQARSAQPDL